VFLWVAAGVATAFCPEPLIELQLVRELNHGLLLSWVEGPLLTPLSGQAAIRLWPSSWLFCLWQALVSWQSFSL
jgi:hypothetical protein